MHQQNNPTDNQADNHLSSLAESPHVNHHDSRVGNPQSSLIVCHLINQAHNLRGDQLSNQRSNLFESQASNLSNIQLLNRLASPMADHLHSLVPNRLSYHLSNLLESLKEFHQISRQYFHQINRLYHPTINPLRSLLLARVTNQRCSLLDYPQCSQVGGQSEHRQNNPSDVRRINLPCILRNNLRVSQPEFLLEIPLLNLYEYLPGSHL